MKGTGLSTPERDNGIVSVRPLLGRVLDRLEELAARLAKKGEPPVNLAAERLLLAELDRRTGDAITLERRRTLHRTLDETYFKVALAAGLQPYEGAVTEPKNGDEIVMRFPAAVLGTNAHAQRTVESRALWPKTRPRVSVWYTSPVGSTNTFNLRFVLRVFGDGSGMTNMTFVTDFSPAGPAVANTVKFISCVGGGVFPTSPFGVAQFRLGRLGGDANAGDLDILLAVVTMEEVA